MPLKGQAKTNYQRNYMRKRRLSILMSSPPRWCVACGESRVVECHHIDRSHDNQLPANLVNLCPTCHKVLHRQGLTMSELMSVRPAEADRYIRNDVMLRSIHKGVDRIISEHPAYIDADGGVVYE